VIRPHLLILFPSIPVLSIFSPGVYISFLFGNWCGGWSRVLAIFLTCGWGEGWDMDIRTKARRTWGRSFDAPFPQQPFVFFIFLFCCCQQLRYIVFIWLSAFLIFPRPVAQISPCTRSGHLTSASMPSYFRPNLSHHLRLGTRST